MARRDLPEHLAALDEHGIGLIDLVVVNLYPFAETIARPNVTLGDAGRDTRWATFSDHEAAGSVMAVPLTFNGAMLGVLTITHPAQEHFTSKDLLLLAGVIAFAVIVGLSGMIGYLGAMGEAQKHGVRMDPRPIMTALGIIYGALILMGVSIGGWTATNCAVRRPGRVTSLTLLDPAMTFAPKLSLMV